MKFYNEKLKEIRKQKKIRADALASQVGVTRTALWFWESGKIIPSESKIKQLAKVLNIPLDMISDLKSDAPLSEDKKYPQIFSSLISLSKERIKERENSQLLHIESILKQLRELNQVVIVTKALMDSIDVMFYVKDTSLKYITANNAFLKNASLSDDFNIVGKTDSDLFPEKEAEENFEEDENVIHSGKQIKSREDYIPGSKKKKWGIISKIPISDTDGKITGVAGCITDITERKKAEHLANMIKNSLNIIDKGIWLSNGELVDDGYGNLAPKNLLYVSSNDLTKRFTLPGTDASFKDQGAYFNSLKLDHPRHDLKALKEKGISIINYRVKAPDTGEIINLETRLYHDPERGIYAGIIERDRVRDVVNSISAKLKELRVNEKIIEKALGIK